MFHVALKQPEKCFLIGTHVAHFETHMALSGCPRLTSSRGADLCLSRISQPSEHNCQFQLTRGTTEDRGGAPPWAVNRRPRPLTRRTTGHPMSQWPQVGCERCRAHCTTTFFFSYRPLTVVSHSSSRRLAPSGGSALGVVVAPFFSHPHMVRGRPLKTGRPTATVDLLPNPFSSRVRSTPAGFADVSMSTP